MKSKKKISKSRSLKKKVSKSRSLKKKVSKSRSSKKKLKGNSKKRYKRGGMMGWWGRRGKKRGIEQAYEDNNAQEGNNAQMERAFALRRWEEETKEETMHQEEKSAEPEPEELNGISKFLRNSLRPELRESILNNSGIKKYFKLKESNFISKLIGELKKKKKEYEKLEDDLDYVDLMFSVNHPQESIDEYTIIKNRMYTLKNDIDKLSEEIKFYLQVLKKRNIGTESSNL